MHATTSLSLGLLLLKKDCSYPAGKAWLGAPGRKSDKRKGGKGQREERGTNIRQKREEREIGLL
jgi:hypothetical protein